jgi:hypothetical protein
MAELWQRGLITLAWSPAHDLHGLEIVMRRQPLGAVLADWLAEDDLDSKPWDSLTKFERAERSERGAVQLSKLIIRWNLADESGRAVVLPERDGTDETDHARGMLILAHCDSDMINDMREAYTVKLQRVAPPLSDSSADGSAESEPETWEMPMEILAPS